MAILKKLSIKQLLKKNYSNSKVLQNLAYGTAKKKADKLKSDLIKELNSHPVTKEIEQGPMQVVLCLGAMGICLVF